MTSPRLFVFSSEGCRSANAAGRMLADRLDSASVDWMDVAVGPASDADTVRRTVEAATGCEVDSEGSGHPIAVAVTGDVDELVLDVVSLDARVAGVAIVDAALSPRSIELLTRWKDVPIVTAADSADPGALATAVALYCNGLHPDREIELVTDLDVDGESFGSTSRSWEFAIDMVVRRLQTFVADLGRRSEVVFTTSDGWEIHGTLAVPDRPSRVPAAVLLHSGRSDRAVFARLERLLTRRGVAALSIDWRGRGLSTGTQTYFELSSSQRAEGWRDAAAALDLLAEQADVDADRIAMLGVVHGAEHAVAGSMGDPRVRMLGLLTGFVPRNEAERSYLLSGDVEVLYVTCEGHAHVTAVMEELVAATPAGRAALRRYPGGAIGYQLFDIDPTLEDTLAHWVADGLAFGRDAER